MLEELNALLEASKDVASPSFEELPDGIYEGIVDGAEFTESKKSGNLMFKWTLKITSGEFENRKEWKYTVLDKPERMKMLVTDLTKFGIDCDSMSKIENGLNDILDVPVTIVIAHKGEYRNISIKPLR